MHDSIRFAYRVRVIEGKLRRLEADPMLDAITGVFVWVQSKVISP